MYPTSHQQTGLQDMHSCLYDHLVGSCPFGCHPVYRGISEYAGGGGRLPNAGAGCTSG